MSGPPSQPPPTGGGCPSCGANPPGRNVWLSLAGWAMPARQPQAEIIPVVQASLELVLEYGWDPEKNEFLNPPQP